MKYLGLAEKLFEVLAWTMPGQADILKKQMPIGWSQKDLPDISVLKKCQHDKSQCGQDVLATFMIGPLTRLEFEWYPYFKKLQKVTLDIIGDNLKKSRKMYDVLDRRRVLLAEVLKVKERDWT